MGTHVLLESAKIAKISRFIHVSTDEVYGEQTMDQEAMSEEQVETTHIFILIHVIFPSCSNSFLFSFSFLPILIPIPVNDIISVSSRHHS